MEKYGSGLTIGFGAGVRLRSRSSRSERPVDRQESGRRRVGRRARLLAIACVSGVGSSSASAENLLHVAAF